MMDLGCHIDGSAIKSLDFDLAVIDFGIGLGFQFSVGADRRVVEAAKEGNDIRIQDMDVDVEGYVREIADEVVEWLNETHVPDDVANHWHVSEQSLFYEEIGDDIWM